MLGYRLREWIVPFLFVAGLGTLLHFSYEISGNNAFIALFSAVNESTWEHLKLLFFPMVIYTVCQILYGKMKPSVIPGNLVATLTGMLVVVVVFYTYIGVIGRDIPFVDISLYYIAVILTLWLSLRLRELYLRFSTPAAILIGILLIILFGIFTFFPPDLGLFRSPA